MKINWRIWFFDNVYIPACFALTLAGMILVAIDILTFWNVTGPAIVLWILNALVWGIRDTGKKNVGQ